jgi:hypothetical protein
MITPNSVRQVAQQSSFSTLMSVAGEMEDFVKVWVIYTASGIDCSAAFHPVKSAFLAKLSRSLAHRRKV